MRSIIENTLFSQNSLRIYLGGIENRIKKEIDGFEEDYLLNTDTNEIINYFVQKYTVEVPILKENEIEHSTEDTQIDVSKDFNRAIINKSKPFFITGTAISFFIPFEGEGKLFRFEPTTTSFYVFPRGSVKDNYLIITINVLPDERDDSFLKKKFNDEISLIKRYLTSIANEVNNFNISLNGTVRSYIEFRRNKSIRSNKMIESLGIKLEKRGDAPKTFRVPTIRKKITLPKPSKNKEHDPTLEMDEYEHILSVISNMVVVMERSPQAFSGMCEEDLRQHFLVQLNGQYKGQATGETFNFEGKTDILIRHEGKNIFIAECKFWDGFQSLRDAIDQLLGYTSWRDTKTALLIFNRTKDFTGVLKKISEVVNTHPNFVREMDYDCETGFRYVIHHRDDPERELILTILAFEVPI